MNDLKVAHLILTLLHTQKTECKSCFINISNWTLIVWV